jgi:putative endonuclease
MNDPNDRPGKRPQRRLAGRHARGAAPGPVGDRVPQPERQVAFRLGISAESRAAAFLIAKGFRILARRWRSPAGEIDIIAARRHLLVFVEVKARENFDDAAWSVTDRQRARIAAAAEAWLARAGDHHFQDMRFDAVLVVPGRIPRHIPAAFDADG